MVKQILFALMLMLIISSCQQPTSQNITNEKVVSSTTQSDICNNEQKTSSENNSDMIIQNVIVSEKTVDNMKILIDPKLEMISVLSILSGEVNGFIDSEDSEYKDRILSYFAEYKKHPMVELYKETQLNFGNLSIFAALINDNLETDKSLMNFSEETYNLTEEEYIYRMTDEGKKVSYLNQIIPIKELCATLKKFYIDTDFNTFYNQNKNYYDEIINSMSKDFDQYDIVSWIENYYGYSKNSYVTFIQPLRTRAESMEFHFAENEKVYSDDKLASYTFTTPRYEKYGASVIVHEISHSFINPISKEQSYKISTFEKLYENVGNKLKETGYDSWWMSCNEHIVEAVTSRFILDTWGDKEYEKYVQQNIDWGFTYQKEISDKLADYEQNRDEYKTFEKYYSKLLNSLYKFM